MRVVPLFRRAWIVPIAFACLAYAYAGGRAIAADPPKTPPAEGLFARDNLIAWCIVPFDSKKRGPRSAR